MLQAQGKGGHGEGERLEARRGSARVHNLVYVSTSTTLAHTSAEGLGGCGSAHAVRIHCVQIC